MQKEPHGEECRHPKVHSKVDRALNFTVIIKMAAFARFQWLSRSMLLVEVIEISVIQTKQVLRRRSDFVEDGIPFSCWILTFRQQDRITSGRNTHSKWFWHSSKHKPQIRLIHCYNHYRVKNILSICLPAHNNTCFGSSKTPYFPFHSFVSVYNLYRTWLKCLWLRDGWPILFRDPTREKLR